MEEQEIVCHQYKIRQENLDRDLERDGLTLDEILYTEPCDYDFEVIDKTDKEMMAKVNEFIVENEWLRKPHKMTTHVVVAKYKGRLAGIQTFSTPNSFSYLLGKENRDLEKLISRGACISWSPINLGSAMLMWGVRWMVRNTTYRVFTGYSDKTAGELGTIYQACNFRYLGDKYGGKVEYLDPLRPEFGWFSDREFRKKAKYKRYARELEIEWNKGWETKYGINWDIVPPNLVLELRARAKYHQRRCECREVPPKHKYALILGRNKRETKALNKLFERLNPDKINFPYPKQRGF